MLELRAVYLVLRWRTRSVTRIKSRFLHLTDSQVSLGVLVKGRSSSLQLNRVISRCNALILASDLLPLFAFVQSEWNPADAISRIHVPGAARREGQGTKRKSTSKTQGILKQRSNSKYRNRMFVKKFDSSLGYPGEGPPLRGKRVPARHVNLVTIRRSRVQCAIGKRSHVERRREREGIILRHAGLAPLTVQIYRIAFNKLWQWAGLPPPYRVTDTMAYDTVLAGYIEALWDCGATRAHAGNAISASLVVFPELKKKLPESWALLSIWSRVELPARAPPMSPALALAVAEHFRLEDDLCGCF